LVDPSPRAFGELAQHYGVYPYIPYIYIYISSLKCSLHSRYPPDVANMIHAIDIVQQDDMMDDHPTSWRCG
jgi:hypothetical protein